MRATCTYLNRDSGIGEVTRVRVGWLKNRGPVHGKLQRVTRVGTLIVATIYLQLMQIDTCFEILLSFTVVTSIVYNPLPAMWKS